MPQLSTLGFEFIAEGIQGLFRDEPGMLSEKLKTLSVLAYRFRRQYVEATTMDWNTPFETSVPFLEDIFTYSSSMDLARSVTVLDEHGFAEIQTLSAPDAAVDNLLIRWDTLSESVWECSCALPELIKLLEECAQVSVFLWLTRFINPPSYRQKQSNFVTRTCLRSEITTFLWP